MMTSVLFVNCTPSPIPPVSGGAVQTVFDTLIKGLCSRSTRVGVLTPTISSSIEESRKDAYSQVTFHPLLGQPAKMGVIGSRKNRTLIQRALTGLTAEYTHCVIFDPFIAPAVRRALPTAKVIWHVHNIQRTGPLLKTVMDSIDEIVCVSNYVRDVTSRHVGVSKRCLTIYNPIDPLWNKDSVSEKEFGSILFAGRIIPQKGLDVLARALSLLDNQLKRKVDLKIAGAIHFADSPTTSAYVSKVKKLLEISQVRHEWLGYVPRESLIEMYDKAQITVVPSVWAEPAALSAVEPQFRGCATIVSDQGGNFEMVSSHWRNLITRKGNSSDIKASLIKVLQMDTDELQYKAISARSFVRERFSVERVIDSWVDILR